LQPLPLTRKLLALGELYVRPQRALRRALGSVLAHAGKNDADAALPRAAATERNSTSTEGDDADEFARAQTAGGVLVISRWRSPPGG